MSEVASMSNSDLLRAAITHARNSEVGSDFQLSQIYTGLVLGNEDLEAVWEEETAPEGAELDLHLGGDAVRGHLTSAKQFSAFVAGISSAVKEIARQSQNRDRYPENLQIEGATPGSVRIVFKVNQSSLVRESDNNPADLGLPTSSADSDALRRVASVLATASDAALDSPLYAEVSDLPTGAKDALRRVARATQTAGWTINGRVRQRHIGVDDISFSPDAALRLKLQLGLSPETVETQTVEGKLDGFRRSLGVVYLVRSSGQSLPISVKSAALLRKVSEIAADPQLIVWVELEVARFATKGGVGRPRVSRSLRNIGVRRRAVNQTTGDLLSDE